MDIKCLCLFYFIGLAFLDGIEKSYPSVVVSVGEHYDMHKLYETVVCFGLCICIGRRNCGYNRHYFSVSLKLYVHKNSAI